MSFTIDACNRMNIRTYTEDEYHTFLHDLSSKYRCCRDSNKSVIRAIRRHLHVKDPLRVTGTLPSKVGKATTYNKHTLQDITTNILTRSLFTDTCSKVEPYVIFRLVILAGIRIPDETVCCAAAIRKATDGTCWLRTIFKIDPNVRVTRDGKLITDAYGDSILSIVSCDNLRRLLKKIHAEGVTELQSPEQRVINAIHTLPALKFTIKK